MFQQFGEPRYGSTGWQMFPASQGTVLTQDWRTWQKPLGCSFVYIGMQASGGGGGGGFTGLTLTARGGGGGGGSGSFARAIIPAFLLPDTLYIRAGSGGVGGGPGGAGTNGTASYVSIYPSTGSPQYLIIQMAGGSFGAAGTVAAGGAAGAAGAGHITTNAYAALALVTSGGGQAGSAGGAITGAAGGNVVWGSGGIFTSGGTGGAGVSTANATNTGGNISSIEGTWTLSGGAIATAGNPGYKRGNLPLLKGVTGMGKGLAYTGGTGGGSGGAVAGGDGAVASYGGGGGGGGGGTTGGSGGQGGDGFIIMGAF